MANFGKSQTIDKKELMYLVKEFILSNEVLENIFLGHKLNK